MHASTRISRRAALLMLLAAPGCSGVIRGRDPAPAPARRALPPPYRLRIAIFHNRRLDLPYHAGLLIDAPQGRILYDPAGFWEHPLCQRHADVHHPMTDETVAAYLNRDGFGFSPESWILHLFETEVSAEVAGEAHALALGRRPTPSLACARAVGALLSELPGFEEIRPSIVTARLLDALQARSDLRYTTRRVPAATARAGS